MIKGFVSNYSEGNYFIGKWIEGEPVNKRAFGMTGSNLDVEDRMMFNIRALRCENCGYLELYAVRKV